MNREIELWPFGKHRGQAVDRVLTDRSYLQWVLAQPWFADDYPELHRLVTGPGPGPEDSPEHNEFQMGFLEEGIRLAVARRLGFGELEGHALAKWKAISRRVGEELGCEVRERESPLGVSALRFEDEGWDVSFVLRPASYVAWIDAEHGKPYAELLDSWSRAKLAAKARAGLRANHGTLDVAVYAPDGQRRPRVLLELKPDLGDDYPGVLRQIQRYMVSTRSTDRKILLVRRARFSTVSLEQVRAFFATAGIMLIRESELLEFLPGPGKHPSQGKGLRGPLLQLGPGTTADAAEDGADASTAASPMIIADSSDPLGDGGLPMGDFQGELNDFDSDFDGFGSDWAGDSDHSSDADAELEIEDDDDWLDEVFDGSAEGGRA